jgi:hypothetical protein
MPNDQWVAVTTVVTPLTSGVIIPRELADTFTFSDNLRKVLGSVRTIITARISEVIV